MPATAASSLPAAAQTASACVLVIGNPPPPEALRRLLGAGHPVLVTAAGEEGIAALGSGGVAAVVCELFSPGVNGLEVLRAAGRRCPPVPVVAVSAGDPFGPSDLPGVAAILGAAAVLRKPYRADDLARAVEKVLGRGKSD